MKEHTNTQPESPVLTDFFEEGSGRTDERIELSTELAKAKGASADALQEGKSLQRPASAQGRPVKKKKPAPDTDVFGLMNGKHLMCKTFLIALVTALVMFLPSILWDEGYFLFLGDFNSQQVPFYMLAHRAVRSGNLGWNWYTDLGANFIGSYSFYLLGSPFFWITLVFPDAAVPYLMGPLLILKYASMAALSAQWLRRYVKNPAYAVLGGLLYAFSGYTLYNTFFNHFLDVMVFFPLMLISMDELVENNTRGVFALSVALCAIVNYVFFAGEAIFMIVYFVVKVWMGGYRTTVKRFMAVGTEAVLGFAMSAFIVWPSLLVMLSNPRSSGMLYGYDFWIYDHERKYWVILLNFFFPPELPSQPVLVTDSYMRWTSVQAYLPVVSMAGVIAWVRSHRKNWVKTLVIVLMIMAFIPGFNSMYTVMNDSYYARWFFMLSLILILTTVMQLDQGDPEEFRAGAKIVAVFTICVILAMIFTPDIEKVTESIPKTVLKDGVEQTISEKVETERLVFGIFNDKHQIPFVFMAGTCLVSIGVLYLLNHMRPKYPKIFASYLVLAVAAFGMIYGNFFLIYGKTRSYDTKNYIIPDAIQGEEKIGILKREEEEHFFRIDNDDSFINMGMFWQVPDMHAFHSVVPVSIMDYYEYIGDERDVNSKMAYKNYASRSLLSMKYFCDRIDYTSDELGDFEEEDPETKMPGYTYRYSVAGFAVWENENWIPMGFTYDSYVTQDEADDLAAYDREKLMVKSLILSRHQVERYDSVLKHADTGSMSFNEHAYEQDCEDRRRETCEQFSFDNSGFSAKITLDKENLVFFSVPYEEGWSAQVNGKPVDVEQVQIGFMAVLCPEGENEIVFTYRTPGLSQGIGISIAAFVILIVYWILAELWKKKEARKAAEGTEAQAAEDAPGSVLPEETITEKTQQKAE